MKKTKDHSIQLELFGASSHSNDGLSETLAAMAAVGSGGTALSSDAATDSAKEDTTGTENSEPAANSGVPEILPTGLRTKVIPTSHDAAEGSIATEPIIMTSVGAPVTVIMDTGTETHSRCLAPENVISVTQPEATTDVAADSVIDAVSAEAISSEARCFNGRSNLGGSDNISDDQASEDPQPDAADFFPQASVTVVPESTSLPAPTPARGSQATCLTANGQSNLGKAQQSARKLKSPKKPSTKPLLPIGTGEEAMKARAATLYAGLAKAAGKSDLEMHSPGPSVPLNPEILESVRRNYLTDDPKYQRALDEHAGKPALLETDEHLAADRARKTIERAMGDLVEIGAVETDVDGNPVAILRLPEVKRILASWGATQVRECPGGKRQLCDAAGNEIHSPLKRRAVLADKHPEPNDQAA